mmetsp:Transcript_16072/g.24968  ORF Transcript_16072/g.24968 Transcript_16072/m.24968 type:complete len:134 (+) Transcript_16072:447-848(+)
MKIPPEEFTYDRSILARRKIFWYIHEPVQAMVRIVTDPEACEGPARRCPKCRQFIEKQDDCNYIVCPDCKVHWCWICNCKMSTWHHFNPVNVFGCPGNLTIEPPALMVILYKLFLIFFMIPVMLTFVPLLTIY